MGIPLPLKMMGRSSTALFFCLLFGLTLGGSTPLQAWPGFRVLRIAQNPAIAQGNAQGLALLARAEAHVQQLSEPHSQGTLWVKIAEGYGHLGETAMALSLFERALALTATAGDDESRDHRAYYEDQAPRQVVQAMTNLGWYDRALSLARTIYPDLAQAQALHTVAQGLIASGDSRQGTAIALEALQVAKGVDRYSFGYEANGSCANDKYEVLNAIAATLIELGRIDTALAGTQEVQSCYAASEPYYPAQNYRSAVYLHLLNHTHSIPILNQILAATQSDISEAEQTNLWVMVAEQFVEQDRPDLAVGVAERIANPAVNEQAFLAPIIWFERIYQLQTIGTALMANGHRSAAEQVGEFAAIPIGQWHDWERRNPDQGSRLPEGIDLAGRYALVFQIPLEIAWARHNAMQGNRPLALELLADHWQQLQQFDGWFAERSQQEVIATWFRIGESDRAWATLASLDPSRREQLQGNLINELEGVAAPEVTRQLVAETPLSWWLLLDLLPWITQQTEPAVLEQLWTRIQGLPLEGWTAQMVIGDLATQFFQVGEPEQGKRVAAIINDDFALQALSQNLMEQGEMATALEIINRIEDPMLQAEAWVAGAIALHSQP